jgi:hypothetical protein
METTRSGQPSHQDVYEWWRNTKDEITNSINDLRSSGSVDPDILDVMEDLLKGVKIRRSYVDYFDEEV